MNKFISLIFIISLIFSSSLFAQNPNEMVMINPVIQPPKQEPFTIKGNVENLKADALIVLMDGVTGAKTLLGKSKQNTIEVSGTTDKSKFCVLVIDENTEVPFFIEPGNLKIKGNLVDASSLIISGTPLNDNFNKYSEEIRPLEQKIAKEQDFFDAKSRTELVNATRKFVQKNNNIAGAMAVFKLIQFAGDRETDIKEIVESLNDKNDGITQFLNQTVSATKKFPLNSKLPDFSQNDANGKEIKFSSISKGKLVLIDFWASWCGPCRRENPNVVKAFEKFKDKGFTVLGVSFDDNKEKWLSAVAADKLNWTQVSDLKGWGNAVGKTFGITAIPQNFLVNDGILIGRNLRGQDLIKMINQVYTSTPTKNKTKKPTKIG